MRSLNLSTIIDLHEDALPVHRIVDATRMPESEVRRIITAYQAALDALWHKPHAEYRARNVVVDAYVGLWADQHDAEWIARRLGITRHAAYRSVNRIERLKERRPARGGAGRWGLTQQQSSPL